MLKKITSVLVATLLLSYTVLAPLAVVAQEQETAKQVQEKQRQATDDSQATNLPESTPTTSPASEVSSNTSSESVNEEVS